MVFGPCGGVRPGGECEVGGIPCPFVDRPPVRVDGAAMARTGPGGQGGPGDVTGAPLVIVDARPLEATLEAATQLGHEHRDWCDAVLLGEHHDRVDLPGSVIAYAARQAGARPWVTLACRDRNAVALESELAACRALEIDVVHCVTGDLRAPHVRPGTTPVFDLDGPRLARMAAGMGLTVSVAESPLAEPTAVRPLRAADKSKAGASWCFVNVGIGAEALDTFIRAARAAGSTMRFIACVAAFTDEEGATRLARLPGVGLDRDEVRRVLDAPRPVEAGIDRTVAEARALLQVDGVDGIDLSGPAATTSAADRVAVMRAIAERLRVVQAHARATA
jgi:methylenetetrahydrofolate reductase (NADPH)